MSNELKMISTHKMKYMTQNQSLLFSFLSALTCPLLLSFPPHPSLLILPVFNGTGHTSPLKLTVAFGDLFQVLLVMVLGIVEVLPLQDLCGNATVAFFIQLLATKEKHRLNVFKSRGKKRTSNATRYETY